MVLTDADIYRCCESAHTDKYTYYTANFIQVNVLFVGTL